MSAAGLGCVFAYTATALPDLRMKKPFGQITSSQETWIGPLALVSEWALQQHSRLFLSFLSTPPKKNFGVTTGKSLWLMRWWWGKVFSLSFLLCITWIPTEEKFGYNFPLIFSCLLPWSLEFRGGGTWGKGTASSQNFPGMKLSAAAGVLCIPAGWHVCMSCCGFSGGWVRETEDDSVANACFSRWLDPHCPGTEHGDDLCWEVHYRYGLHYIHHGSHRDPTGRDQFSRRPLSLAHIKWYLLAGFVGGAINLAIPVFLTEVSDVEIRGALTSCLDMMVTVGILYM